MSNNKFMGSSYPGGGGSGGPYVTFMNNGNYSGDGSGMIQIHRGHEMEQHGADMVSALSPDLCSPGHDSVSSSVTVGSGASSGCRNSTTSTDSGRGSSISSSVATTSHCLGVSRPSQPFQHRLSNVSSSQSSLSSRHSHDSSSSSIQDR